ncbi:MAG: hydrolase [Lachnospiraceae bacterium]|jgi:hypothetical protein|nr:hydrolase [Lachnospiraceae bacterium]MDE7326068.1 hydrolase [Lachnospiraceae bacterium]
MGGYDFYLGKCKLPIAPGKLQVKINNANDTVTLINEGEINLLKTPGLTDIEFECLIPQTEYPFASYPSGFQEASYYLDCFETLKVGKKPFQFIVSRAAPTGKTFFSTDIKVALEDYQITEQAENGFDLKVKVKLRQYREYGTKMVEITEDSPGGGGKLKKTRAESTVQPSKPIGIGSDVIVNGQLHRDSYGGGPGQVKSNYRGKINFINHKGTYPYHVTTPSGGWLGWVGAKCVKGV